MNYKKMWEELKEIINTIKKFKINRNITGAMKYLEKKIEELEKGENND